MKIRPIDSRIVFKSGYPTNPWSGYHNHPNGVTIMCIPQEDCEQKGHVLHGAPMSGRHLNLFA